MSVFPKLLALQAEISQMKVERELVDADRKRLRDALESAYQSMREQWWQQSGHCLAQHLADFKGETDAMKKIRVALEGGGT